jgi:hypothetical protein
MHHVVCGDACDHNRDARDGGDAHAEQRHGADSGALRAPVTLRPRAVPGLTGRLNRAGCLERVLHRRRALPPEVIGAWRQRRLWFECGIGSNPALRGRIGRFPKRHQFVSRTEPVARKLQHVALGPSFVPDLPSLPPFRFHEVCRPFVVGRADNILGRR